MADTTISGLSRILSTDSGAIIPISIAGVTYGIPVSAIITSQGDMGTGSFQLPKGTTDQRIANLGALRFNTTVSSLEFFNGTGWQLLNSVSYNLNTVEYVVVGGGGGGAGAGYIYGNGGAGGSGGYRSSVSGERSGGGSSSEPPLQLTVNSTYSVVVGAGGSGQIGGNPWVNGSNGFNSSFASIVALGGGGGGGYTKQGSLGGSGGGGGNGDGGAGLGTVNQGYDGGIGQPYSSIGYGGGGGGAGQAGVLNQGGSGIASFISGSLVYRGGGGSSGAGAASLGGGGVGSTGNSNGTAGQANTGGGGGGANNAGAGTGGGTGLYTGGNGGTGVVIVRYIGSTPRATTNGGVTGSYSLNGISYTYHMFTDVGSYNFTWNG